MGRHKSKKKLNAREIEAEVSKHRDNATVIVKSVKYLCFLFGFIALCYFSSDILRSYSGQETKADIVIELLAGFSLNYETMGKVAPWAVSMVAIFYALVQRAFRRQTQNQLRNGNRRPAFEEDE